VIDIGGFEMKVISSFTGLAALAIIMASVSLALTPTAAKATTGEQQANDVNLNAPGGVERYWELFEEQGS
jgi:hypothetical protein